MKKAKPRVSMLINGWRLSRRPIWLSTSRKSASFYQGGRMWWGGIDKLKGKKEE
jgi:hypothetical protein